MARNQKPRINNPVAKYNNEFNKPATHRNKKKDNKVKVAEEELRHPHNKPYRREHRNLTKDVMNYLLKDEDE